MDAIGATPGGPPPAGHRPVGARDAGRVPAGRRPGDVDAAGAGRVPGRRARCGWRTPCRAAQPERPGPGAPGQRQGGAARPVTGHDGGPHDRRPGRCGERRRPRRGGGRRAVPPDGHLRRAAGGGEPASAADRPGGEFVAPVDLAYPGDRLAIELDGLRWHAGRGPFRSDRLRGDRIEAAGWRLLETAPEDIGELGASAGAIVRRAA